MHYSPPVVFLPVALQDQMAYGELAGSVL